PALVAVLKLPAGVKPHEKAVAGKSTSKSATDFEAAVLLIYDCSGREQVAEKLLKWAPDGKTAVTTKSSAHTDVYETKSGTTSSYRTMAGHYLVQSDYKEVLDHWAARLSAASPARGALVESADFRAARARMGANPA